MPGFNIGTALAGYGQAQPQIQQLQQMQAQKQQQAGIAQAMKRYQAQQQQQNPGGQVKPPDPMQMMDMLSKSGLPEDQQGAIWERYAKEINPIEKMQSQFDLGIQKIDSARTRLEDQQGYLLKLQSLKESELNKRNEKRGEQQTETRDATSVAKELADQRTLLTGMLNANPKSIDTPEYKAEKETYDALRTELDSLRKGGTAKPAGPGKQGGEVPITRGAAGNAPDVSKLSDKEERSLDGGKTWWRLENGKPVQAE